MGKTKASSLKNSGESAKSQQANTTQPEARAKRIAEAPSDKRFVLRDGRVLKDLVELSNALEYMSDDVFNHHVNQSRNDFRNWVADVLGEKDLAAAMEKTKSKNDIQMAVLKHIVKMVF